MPVQSGEGAGRLRALNDAERILTQAYYSPCPPGSHINCERCGLLERVLTRIHEWQDEETRAARQAATLRRAAVRAAVRFVDVLRGLKADG
jgi:hypothetical protein